jgi:carbamate kinase
MLQQVLQNLCKREALSQDVLTMITQVIVDSEDSCFKDPIKPVGPFYKAETKEFWEKQKGHVIKRVKSGNDRPFRRVVPSPNPLRIIEARAISRLVDDGILVIASGGGGIPVVMDATGDYHGADAVVDKDLAGEKLAEGALCDIFLVLTDVETVFLNFGTPKQRALELVHLEEAKTYLRQGHFSSGSMAPKVEACIRFLEFGGERAIITSLDKIPFVLHGFVGTHFIV